MRYSPSQVPFTQSQVTLIACFQARTQITSDLGRPQSKSVVELVSFVQKIIVSIMQCISGRESRTEKSIKVKNGGRTSHMPCSQCLVQSRYGTLSIHVRFGDLEQTLGLNRDFEKLWMRFL
jgi:hypothetical protein